MKKAGPLRSRSGAKWECSRLPPDLQTLIFELADRVGLSDLNRLETFEFVEWLVPLDAFPDVELWTDYRDKAYARKMFSADLPPILLCNRQWIDGRHRVWAWREQGFRNARAIDLAEFGFSTIEFHFGVLRDLRQRDGSTSRHRAASARHRSRRANR